MSLVPIETTDKVTLNTPESIKENTVSDSHRIVIKPTKSWFDIDWQSFWAYRELLYFLALRDVKVRYKQTFVGVAWVLLQPIATTLIFSVIFLRFGQNEINGIHYSLYAFSGFVLWTFINAAITNASNSLTNNTGLITKVYFPRLIVPTAAVAAGLLDLLIAVGSLALAMIFYGVKPSWTIIFAPLFILQMLILVFGGGILLAALNVRYRDVKQILPFALQLWLFVSPVFYSAQILPEKLVWIWRFNPLNGILQGFRSALFAQEFDFTSIVISIALTILVLLLGLYVFHRMEDDFADVI